jgi:hypothetical protein
MAPLRAPGLERGAEPSAACARSERSMLDLVLLALGLGVFALMAAYAAGCDRV